MANEQIGKHPEGLVGKEIDSPSLLAMAISRRSSKETDRTQVRLAEISELPFTPMPTALVEPFIISTARFTDARLQDSSYSPSIDDSIRAIYGGISDDEIMRALIEDSTEEEAADMSDDVDPTKMREAFISIAQNASHLISPALFDRADFDRSLAFAQQVATREEVPIEDVYENDEMYEEVARLSSTSEEVARRGLSGVERVTPEKLEGFLIDAMISILSAIKDPDDVFTGEFQQDIIDDFKNSSDFQIQLAQAVARVKYAGRVFIGEYLERVWGMGTVGNLPEEVLAELNIDDRETLIQALPTEEIEVYRFIDPQNA